MKRRDFIAASSVLGLAPWALAEAASPAAPQRAVLELRKYEFATQSQRDGFEKFAAQAAIPALNRAGIKPVGIFSRDGFTADELDEKKRLPEGELSPAYVLLPHPSLESVATLVQRLSEDSEIGRASCRERV